MPALGCDDDNDHDVLKAYEIQSDSSECELIVQDTPSCCCESTASLTCSTTTTTTTASYNPRKPKWWKHLAGRATKGQKRAIHQVLHVEGLRLQEIPYGSRLESWDQVFGRERVQDDSDNENKMTAISATKTRRRVWLELGFGRGENLLALSFRMRRDPKFCLIGAEIHNPGIGMICQRIQEAWNNPVDGASSGYWTDFVPYSPRLDAFAYKQNESEALLPESPTLIQPTPSTSSLSSTRSYSSLRIHAGDGFKLLRKLPTHSLDAILVTFPDPFPKEDEVQWRLIQNQTLKEFHRILQKSCYGKAGRFFLATDHQGYFAWTHALIEEVNKNEDATKFRKVEPCPNRMEWLPAISTYELKGWKEGRRTNLACWEAT